MKYETDSSYDKEIREKKVHEFYYKSLDVYINPNFTRNSIGKMLKKLKEKFELRKYTKELLSKYKLTVGEINENLAVVNEESRKIILEYSKKIFLMI